jgi:hypothetical protein
VPSAAGVNASGFGSAVSVASDFANSLPPASITRTTAHSGDSYRRAWRSSVYFPPFFSSSFHSLMRPGRSTRPLSAVGARNDFPASVASVRASGFACSGKWNSGTFAVVTVSR